MTNSPEKGPNLWKRCAFRKKFGFQKNLLKKRMVIEVAMVKRISLKILERTKVLGTISKTIRFKKIQY